jgi:hypothetical protein
MDDLTFRCFQCERFSPMNLTAENRGRVYRLHGDPHAPKDVTFYCVNCGTANVVSLTLEAASELLKRIASNDPATQAAIDAAKRGDYSRAIDEARRRFRF